MNTKTLLISSVITVSLLGITAVAYAATHPVTIEAKQSKEINQSKLYIEEANTPSESSDTILKSTDIIATLNDITVFGAEEDNGMYESISIQRGDSSRTLSWKNVSNPSYFPEIYEADLNGDGQQEIIVILTTGYGTGVYESEAHILDSDLTIIPVEDANIVFLKQFKGSITEDKVLLDVAGQQLAIPTSSLSSTSDHLFNAPSIGAHLRYFIEDNTLRAVSAVGISPTEFIGELQIEYVYNEHGLYEGGKVTFAPID